AARALRAPPSPPDDPAPTSEIRTVSGFRRARSTPSDSRRKKGVHRAASDYLSFFFHTKDFHGHFHAGYHACFHVRSVRLSPQMQDPQEQVMNTVADTTSQNSASSSPAD